MNPHCCCNDGAADLLCGQLNNRRGCHSRSSEWTCLLCLVCRSRSSITMKGYFTCAKLNNHEGNPGFCPIDFPPRPVHAWGLPIGLVFLRVPSCPSWFLPWGRSYS